MSQKLKNFEDLEDSVQVLLERKCQHCQIQTDSILSKYDGADYMYKFDDGVVRTINNEHLCMKGVLKPLLPFGHIFHIDFDSVSEEETSVLKWGEEIGLVKPNSKLWIQIQKTAPACAAAILNSGVPLNSARLSTLWYFTVWVLDDIIDNIHYESRSSAFNYKNLMKDVETFLSFLLSKDDEKMDEDKLNAIRESVGKGNNSTFALPNLLGFCKAMIDTRKAANQTGANPSYFLAEFSSYTRFGVMESTQNNPTNQVEFEYAYIKERTQGLRLTYESNLLVHGVCPSESLRENPRFATFLYLVLLHYGLVHDLLSLKKELSLDETQNMVLVRCRVLHANVKKVKNMTASTATPSSYLQQAFDSLVNETNIIATRILEVKPLLEEELTGTDNEEIGTKCIDIALNLINSHIPIYVNSERYLNNRGIHYIFPNDNQ